jgi:predicted Holliday junction resolvase-like endonuclease
LPPLPRSDSLAMPESLDLAALVAAVVLLVWTAASYARYRAVYRYADDDLEAARADAAKRSRSVRAGKAVEQLIPLVGEFAERFDSHDARFLGAPVDYVVFDGLASGVLREVVLVEVKTGSSRLTPNEREVELAIAEGRVRYEVVRL